MRSQNAEYGGCAALRGSAQPSLLVSVRTLHRARPHMMIWCSESSAPMPRTGCGSWTPAEHHTREGRLYLCAVKDVFSNKIVGYSIDSRMKARIAVNALEMAVTHRGNPRCVIVHSDRGSQFRSDRFLKTLRRHKLHGSMGQVGAAGDNAAMESFFSLLQKNVLNRRVWDTREELRLAIVGWIEGKYHRKRRQRTLGKLTPIEFKTVMDPAATQAA